MESCRKEDFSEASAVHKGEFRNFLNIGVAKVSLLSSRQLSHACAPIATKCFVRASAVIPVELRQPGASSLVLACSADPRGDGSSLKVNSARLIHPWKRYCPNLASLLNIFATPSDAYTHCKEQHSAKALYPKSRQPGAKTLFSSLQSRKTLSEMPTTVAGSLTMRSCRQFCQASAPMSLMPDSTLTCLRRGTPAKAPSVFFHEYGRRVGMVPRSSLKEGKNSLMVEKGTRTTKTTQNQTNHSPQTESPPSCSLSSVLGETSETKTND